MAKKNYGEEDGKQMFESLQDEVDQYNAKHASIWVEKHYCSGMRQMMTKIQILKVNVFQRKRRKKELSNKPLSLVLLTPLIARAHQEIQQASEIVFCNSTASLDTSIFILSTASTASGISLAIMLTSDE